MKNSTLIFSLFLFFSTTIVYSQSTDEELTNIFRDAYLSAEKQNYDQAIENYSKYINLCSFEDSVAIAFYNRGHSYFAISDYQKAYDDFDTTIVILSNLDSLKKIPRLTSLAFNYRGLCCENLGMLEEASIDFFISQLSDTTLFQPVFNGARSCEAREVFDTAIDEYYRAIYLNFKYSNDIDALLHMLYRAGMLSRKLGNYENAIQDFEMYLSFDSTDVDVINKLGNTYASMKNEEKALSCYLKAIEYNPNFQDAVFNTGVAYLKLGDNSKSIEYIRKAIKLNDKISYYFKTLGVAMLISNQKDESVYDFCYQFEKACDLGDCEYLNQYCL